MAAGQLNSEDDSLFPAAFAVVINRFEYANKEPYCNGREGYNVARVGGENCQGFTDCVREEYNRLTSPRKIRVEVWADAPMVGVRKADCLKTAPPKYPVEPVGASDD